MRSSTLAVVILALLVLVVPSAEAQTSPIGPGEQATVATSAKKKQAKSKQQARQRKAKQGKAKRKRCRKGYVLRTVKVKRKGKTVRVKRCRKKPAPKKRQAAPPATPTPSPGGPANPPADDAARKLVESKLANTRFTNCADGWNLVTCIVETRYNHFSDGRFVYCRLTPGPKETVSSTFEIQNPRTEADGSWSFDGVVPNHGTYRWRVGADGQVSGSFQAAGEEEVSTLLPLQQAAGTRDCAA